MADAESGMLYQSSVRHRSRPTLSQVRYSGQAEQKARDDHGGMKLSQRESAEAGRTQQRKTSNSAKAAVRTVQAAKQQRKKDVILLALKRRRRA